MQEITIQQLAHNNQYFRVIQGYVIYEPLTYKETITLVSKLLTDFADRTMHLFEIRFRDEELSLRRQHGWCVRGNNREEVERKFDNRHEVEQIKELTDEMPIKKYRVVYDFYGYGSPNIETRTEEQFGRTPSEAMYWFREYFPTPLGTYVITDVEEVE